MQNALDVLDHVVVLVDVEHQLGLFLGKVFISDRPATWLTHVDKLVAVELNAGAQLVEMTRERRGRLHEVVGVPTDSIDQLDVRKRHVHLSDAVDI